MENLLFYWGFLIIGRSLRHIYAGDSVWLIGVICGILLIYAMKKHDLSE